jgi:hypothetical protein
MKTRISQILVAIIICVTAASCNFFASEKQHTAKDSVATPDTTVVLPPDSTQIELQSDTIKDE